MAKIVQKRDFNLALLKGVGHAEMNSAIAKQNGVANESTQTQRYDKNTASVNQDGTRT
jgi:hypothetical protein